MKKTKTIFIEKKTCVLVACVGVCVCGFVGVCVALWVSAWCVGVCVCVWEGGGCGFFLFLKLWFSEIF